MKKIFAIVLCFCFIMLSFCGCRQTNFELTSSEIDELYKDEEDTVKITHPVVKKILGHYSLTTIDNSSSVLKWRVLVSEKNGKLFLQLIKGEEKFVTPSDKALSNVISNYDEETGEYTQRYKAKEYISSYNASFYYDEEGKICINLKNTFIYSDDEDVNEGLSAIGYKED